jgi:hypothetical protein
MTDTDTREIAFAIYGHERIKFIQTINDKMAKWLNDKILSAENFAEIRKQLPTRYDELLGKAENPTQQNPLLPALIPGLGGGILGAAASPLLGPAILVLPMTHYILNTFFPDSTWTKAWNNLFTLNFSEIRSDIETSIKKLLIKSTESLKTIDIYEKQILTFIFISSTILFSLGFITQIWQLISTSMQIRLGINIHPGPYQFLKQVFGESFANVVLGQFRDMFTPIWGFARIFLFKGKEIVKEAIPLYIAALNIFALGFMGLEFYQANIKNGSIDIIDIISFSVLPITTVIYGVYYFWGKKLIITFLHHLF